ncbi:MAG: hypothetical protein ACI4PS_05695 [Rhodocyclaceae bacterium]
MFTINVADKHKVLSDLMNIFGKLHQKGFSDEQILNICHTFFKSEVEDNIDFCLKINKLESCASCDKIDEPTLHFKINIDFINKILKIQKAVECVRELSSSIFTLDGEKVVLDSNTEILQGISSTEKTKPSLPEIKPEVNAEEVKQLEEPVAEVEAVEEIPTEEIAPEAEIIEEIPSEEIVSVEEVAEVAEVETVEEIPAEEIAPEAEIIEEIPSEEIVSVAEAAEISEPEIESEPVAEVAEISEVESAAEVEAEPEIGGIDFGSEISEIGDIGKPDEVTEIPAPAMEMESVAEPVAEIAEEIGGEISNDDLSLDFPAAEEPAITEMTETPEMPEMNEISENLDADLSELPPPPDEEPIAEDLGESLSLDDLDFSMATASDLAELEGESAPSIEPTPSQSASSDDNDILLEISDPTEADLAALQEKLNKIEHQ